MKTGKILILLLLACLQGALTALGVSVLTQHYEYDENGRLVAVTVPENPLLNERYRYDGSGNLVEKQLGERIYRMSYDGAHQLKSQEGPEGYRAFYYDGAGRLVRETLEGKTVAQYRYGYLDKVVEVTRNGERAEFFYDGQGMLAGKRVNGEYEAWTWDGLALVARGEERYVNEGHISGGVPVLSRSRDGVRYHQTDILGTTLATYTADGKMEPVLASAFGAEMGAGSLTGTHRFTGKPYDRHLGAHVFPYRNYDATVARWRSSDPAGFPDGPNGHFYAPVPTMGLDPWGLAEESYDPTNDLTLVLCVINGWSLIGYDYSARRANHSLDFLGDENAPAAEINSLKSATSFTSKFNNAYFNNVYKSSNGGQYSLLGSNTNVNYGYTSDIGLAYGNVTYEVTGSFTIVDGRWETTATFQQDDKYDFATNSSNPAIAAFNRLQENGHAQKYDTHISFTMKFYEM